MSANNYRGRTPRYLLTAIFVIAALAVPGVFATSAVADPPGNNGTIKIHEQGTPSGTESNDPKVCVFNVEGYTFDSGQTGYLQFEVQGGDGPTGVGAGPYDFGPTDANGYYATEYFNLQPGHYKATLYGKDTGGGINLEDVKAKSKVFKVTCEEVPPPPPPPPPVEDYTNPTASITVVCGAAEVTASNYPLNDDFAHLDAVKFVVKDNGVVIDTFVLPSQGADDSFDTVRPYFFEEGTGTHHVTVVAEGHVLDSANVQANCLDYIPPDHHGNGNDNPTTLPNTGAGNFMLPGVGGALALLLGLSLIWWSIRKRVNTFSV